MKMPRIGLRTAQGLVLVLAISCGEASDIGVPSREETLDDGWKAFRAQVVESVDRPGMFIVEGDIAIHGEEALRRYYKEYMTRASQPLTVRLRSTGVDDVWGDAGKHALTYCVANTFGARKQTVVAAIATAAESWSRRVGVTLTYVPSEDDYCDVEPPDFNFNVTFDVRPASAGEGYIARAFYPSYTRDQSVLSLHARAFNPATSGGNTLDETLRHELGHVLGFRHEHIWVTPTAMCPKQTPDPEDYYGPGHGDDARQLIGGYDVLSVMHYPECRPAGSPGSMIQTETDYRAAISIYGLAPSLIASAVTPL